MRPGRESKFRRPFQRGSKTRNDTLIQPNRRVDGSLYTRPATYLGRRRIGKSMGWRTVLRNENAMAVYFNQTAKNCTPANQNTHLPR